MATTIYISIGNSDDKLTQSRWSAFVTRTRDCVVRAAAQIHGQWYSPSDGPWQNACWCLVLDSDYKLRRLQAELHALAGEFNQEAITWAIVAQTQMIGPNGAWIAE